VIDDEEHSRALQNCKDGLKDVKGNFISKNVLELGKLYDLRKISKIYKC